MRNEEKLARISDWVMAAIVAAIIITFPLYFFHAISHWRVIEAVLLFSGLQLAICATGISLSVVRRRA